MTSAQLVQSSCSHQHDEGFPVTSVDNVIDKKLSGEVIDNIVDHLYDDISSLKVCALPGTPGKTHFDLIHWSQNHQEAALHVVRLCIEGTANFMEFPCGSEVAVEDVELLLPLLPHLQEVVLRGVTLSSHLPADGSHIPSCCRRIQALTVVFGATADTTFRPLCHLLLLCSQVTSLHVQNLQYEWDPSFEDSPLFAALRSALRVEYLHVHSDHPAQSCSGYLGILELYRQAQPRWPLRKLELGLPRMTSEDSLNDILGGCAGTLSSLAVFSSASITQDIRDTPTITTLPLIERWRLPNLRMCQSLQFLNVPLLTIPILKDTEEENRAVSEWLSTYYEYSIGAITEIVLSSPLQLSAVGLLFIHAGDPYDTRVTERLDQVSCWQRLDDAIVGLPGIEEVICSISKDPGRVLERAAETAIRHGTTPYSEISGPDVESDDITVLLKRKLPRTDAAYGLQFALFGV